MSSKSKAWAQWESDFAEKIDGKKVRLSGRMALFKGDVKDDYVLADCKYTHTDTYTLTEEMWDKLAEWARNESREPVLPIRTCDAELVVISQSFYYEVSKNPQKPRLNVSVPHKSRNLGFAQSGTAPSFFVIGHYKLAAYSCERFVSDLVDYEMKREDEGQR